MEFQTLLASLKRNDVHFVIVGGLAATLHGSARVTYDLDILYDRSAENLSRIVAALQPFDPYLRGAPRGLPFKFDAETLKRGLKGRRKDFETIAELEAIKRRARRCLSARRLSRS